MLQTTRLPSPPYRDAARDLCAIASYATATFPVCGRALPEFLADVKRLGVATNAAGAELAPEDYYNAHAETMFLEFQATNGQHLSMIDWFCSLSNELVTPAFHSANSRCSFTPLANRVALHQTLMLREAASCVGYAFQLAEGAEPKCHYVTSWYDADAFHLLDPGTTSLGQDDGSYNTLDDAVRRGGLAANRCILDDWWAVVVTVRAIC